MTAQSQPDPDSIDSRPQPERVFLGFNGPLSNRAADWLLANGPGSPRLLDLRHWLLVTAGRRAGRIILGDLIDAAEAAGRSLVPPRLLTPGSLMDHLIPIDNAASTDTVLMAWIEALRSFDSTELIALIPNPPATEAWLSWRSLARLIMRLHGELAGEERTFQDVASATAGFDLPRETERWELLARIEARLHELLAREGLVEAFSARAGLVHETTGMVAEAHVVLLGLPELNGIQQRALRRSGLPVTALIAAPESFADRFDDLGLVRVESWCDHVPSLREEQIHIVESATDQARAVVELIARWNDEAMEHERPTIAPDDLTIGVGDPTFIRALTRAVEQAGLHVHNPEGSPLDRAAPARLLDAAARWLDEPRFVHMAALLRHPDLELWLNATLKNPRDAEAHGGWLTLLDEYFAAHLHDRFDGTWLGEAREQAALRAIHQAVNTLFHPLQGSPRALREWIDPILDVLINLYGPLEAAGKLPPEIPKACLAIREVVRDWRLPPEALQPVISGSAAVRLLVQQLADTHQPAERRAEAVELVGWLELLFDPSPSLIITGVHDGAIPSRPASDPFLPETLRRALHLPTAEHRLARDAYLLEAILLSRPRAALIAGRRNPADEPLTPSRLLLRGDDETLLHRVRQLCGETAERPPALPRGLRAGDESRFTVPALPLPLEPPRAMSVTEFRDYLACPYRYALRRCLRLRTTEATLAELNPMQFGDLAHKVLESFGRDPLVRESRDPREIEAFLLDALIRQMQDQFGTHLLPAVRIQQARLEQRLRDFARKQAGWRAEGWRIEAVEQRFTEEDIALDIPDDDPMPLRAAIDRIDRHERTRIVRVIDYKTSESGDSPHMIHHGVSTVSDDWIDLQLPLYHYLLARSEVDLSSGVELGYIVLPKQTDGAAYRPAQWTEDDLHHAVECARRVVRDIRAQRFPMNREIASSYDAFARLCQSLVMTLGDDEDDDDSSNGDES